MKNWISKLAELNPCTNAIEWAEKFNTPQEAWNKCERGDWMLWLLGKLVGSPRTKSRKKLVLIACECARLALPYIPKGETRLLKAIETAEAWARGTKGITLKDVRSAANAAYDATDDAAYAAAYAVYAAAAANAANAAANAVYAADAAYAAAKRKTLKQCTDIVRKYYPDVEELL